MLDICEVATDDPEEVVGRLEGWKLLTVER
jgi:hypothetical protein